MTPQPPIERIPIQGGGHRWLCRWCPESFEHEPINHRCKPDWERRARGIFSKEIANMRATIRAWLPLHSDETINALYHLSECEQLIEAAIKKRQRELEQPERPVRLGFPDDI